jgi:light-regulated signal transduction histidine kinase (bacteriophytochrome)
MELPLFEFAIALTAWFAGLVPSTVTVVLSALCFDFFFTEPRYSFDIAGDDVPYFILFAFWALLVAWFVNVRRRIEADLREARDQLLLEVEQRRQREDEVRTLNDELAKRATELEASNKELEAFAYSVSHDLRAPLRHSVGYAELLQKHASSLLDDKCRRYIQTILDASKRMGNLIDDLLSFSRIGRADAKQTFVSLDKLVDEAVTEIRSDAKGRDIAWKIGPLPVCYGDRSMLKLVIGNLISNAVKFTRKRPLAEIEIGYADAGKDGVEVFVRDNGTGFDMQYANQLFGVFQRLHLRDEYEGTGIGLAIVQRVVHRHGGRVRAYGEVDKGATFYFSLPKARDAAERIANTL